MTILYVDDDKEDQEVFAEVIQAIDPAITILFADDGLASLKVLAAGDPPEIIFLDFAMPFLNGHQTLLEIRKNDKLKASRVVIYSTYTNLPLDEEYASLNADYLKKPNTINEAIETVRAVIWK